MVRAKKHLGQHFLNDESVIEKIVREIESFAPKAVLEVGPGTGALTNYLLLKDSFAFKAVEVDKESIIFLKEQYPNKDFIIQGDFLRLDVTKIFDGDFLLAGNFPYNISSQIVFKLLENKAQIPQMVGMFQSEVAHRIIASPNNKVYGILSVLTQAFYNTKLLLEVPPSSFIPPPKVNSTVISLLRKPESETQHIDYKKLKEVVKIAFNQRRKTLRNGLKSYLNTDDPRFVPYSQKRAENLSYLDFLKLIEIRDNHL